MARSRADLTKVTKAKAQKDHNFEDILKQHKDIQDEGWYKGKFTSVKVKGNSIIVEADIYDLEGDVYYGNIKGFLPTNYTEDDVTPDFLKALDFPKKFSDIKGKEAKVYVDFTETDEGKEYANIYGYDKL